MKPNFECNAQFSDSGVLLQLQNSDETTEFVFYLIYSAIDDSLFSLCNTLYLYPRKRAPIT